MRLRLPLTRQALILVELQGSLCKHGRPEPSGETTSLASRETFLDSMVPVICIFKMFPPLMSPQLPPWQSPDRLLDYSSERAASVGSATQGGTNWIWASLGCVRLNLMLVRIRVELRE